MRVFLLALLIATTGAASASEPFASEEDAARAVAELGPAWRDQSAPPQDFASRIDPSPAMALVRQSPRKRRLFYAGKRAVDLEWNRAGALDRIGLYDPGCWQGDRRRAFSILLRHVGGDARNLPLLVSAATHVFDADHLPGLTIGVAPQRTIHLRRTSRTSGCSIEMRRETNRAI
ncbi:hypothetical protein E2493_14610 [Sphingomonas parva]|uniref:Lytic transglycosylase domain-containing protein n=1 Tax=Sphingomonas parva TaxID=2555898 RepID=A0A4Y8ZN35_9SPHN|nr:hypothetical protein [Sphingomonas parva]TFI57443.1 hypothetical protein E2493_14610 [Sphingomonas parva]